MSLYDYKIAKKYFDLFTSPLGQEVLDDMRKSWGRQTFDPDSVRRTDFFEGKRSALLAIEFLCNLKNIEDMLQTQAELTDEESPPVPNSQEIL